MTTTSKARKSNAANLWKNMVTSDPAVLAGKPCIAGTRISVELILEQLSTGESVDDVVHNYPHLTREQVLAAIEFTLDVMRDVAFFPHRGAGR